jgi:polysaccharide biosynthesis transport protein
MSLSELLQILKSRLWLIVLVPIVAAAVAFVMTARQPVLYSTKATILIDYRKPLEGQLAGEMLPVGLQAGYLSTQIGIIKSGPVAERVIADLDLASSPVWRTRYEAAGPTVDFETWAVGALRDRLSVKADDESRLVNVWFSDPVPEVAAEVANGFAEAYRQTNKQLGRGPAIETAESVESLLAKLRADLETAENKVSEYQSQAGIIATEQRLDIENAHLNELMKQQLDAESRLRMANTRAEVLDGADTASLPEVLDNSVVTNLQIEVARKEGQIADLSTTLGARHPNLVQARAELASLRRQLDAEVAKIVRQLRQSTDEAGQLVVSSSAAVAAQREKMLELRRSRDGLEPLLRELESARSSYDRALNMYSEYAMHGNLNQTNVSVVSSAHVPKFPHVPNKMMNAISAFIAALFLALGAILVWELLDRRLRSSDAVADLDDVDVLGELPRVRFGA